LRILQSYRRNRQLRCRVLRGIDAVHKIQRTCWHLDRKDFEMKKLFTLALLSAAVAAPAFAEPATQTFTRDGESYQYEVKDAGEYKVISGRNLTTGQDFSLRVRQGRVSGNYAGNAVAFAAPATADKVAAAN
jgi:hypothetical protein